MVPDLVKKIIFTLSRFPVQLFGGLDEGDNDVNGIQRFALGVSDQLSSTFFKNTRFIVPENRRSMLSEIASSFLAYYLPSVLNGVKSQVLGTESDVLITDALTGCAFVATETKDGQVKVYHFNVRDEKGNIDVVKMDLMIREAVADETIIFELKKPDYDLFPGQRKRDQDPVFLIGLKGEDNHWSFHYQLSTKTGFTYVNTMKLEEISAVFNESTSRAR